MTSTTLVRSVVLLCALIPVGSAQVSAGIVFYTSEAAFDAASPALSTQTFASATIKGTFFATIANPLNSSTSNTTFAAGSILAGLSMATSVERAGVDLDVVKAGIFGNTNKAIYNDYGGDSLNTTFSGGATAVGLGLLNPNGTLINFIVNSTNNSRLGSQVVTVTSAGPSVFFGAIATGGDQIGQISLLGTAANGNATQAFEGFDRIVFSPSTVTSVPEPASLALVALGLVCLVGRRAVGSGNKRAGICTLLKKW